MRECRRWRAIGEYIHGQRNAIILASILVCPGEIHTRMVDDILAKRGGDPARNLRELAAGIPMRRLAIPPKSRAAMHFLASDLASYVTGTNLSVDGEMNATGGRTLETDTALETDMPIRVDAYRSRALRFESPGQSHCAQPMIPRWLRFDVPRWCASPAGACPCS